MRTSIIRSNGIAIEAVENGQELLAQKIFRENVKRSPCCETWNNLGVYYWVYGMHLPDGRIISAEKIGIRYLKKAALLEKRFQNYVSLASAQCEQHHFDEAYDSFGKAYEQKKDDMVAYNMAACLFRLKDYGKAIQILDEVYQHADIEGIIWNGGQHPLIVAAYCEMELGDFDKCLQRLYDYRKEYPKEELHDVFVLRFLCGQYEAALSECGDLLTEWYATDALCAIIAECLAQVMDCKMDILSKHTCRAERIGMLVENPILRKELIKNYYYVPPIIKMYQFIEANKETE